MLNENNNKLILILRCRFPCLHEIKSKEQYIVKVRENRRRNQE